jgi:hypothetical protein
MSAGALALRLIQHAPVLLPLLLPVLLLLLPRAAHPP